MHATQRIGHCEGDRGGGVGGRKRSFRDLAGGAAARPTPLPRDDVVINIRRSGAIEPDGDGQVIVVIRDHVVVSRVGDGWCGLGMRNQRCDNRRREPCPDWNFDGFHVSTASL